MARHPEFHCGKTLKAFGLGIGIMMTSLRARRPRPEGRRNRRFITWARFPEAYWEPRIHGRVFEPERRAISLAIFRKSLELADVDLSPESTEIFNERARAFLVDNERDKLVALRVRNHPFVSGKSGADGGISAGFDLPVAEAGTVRSVRVEADRRGRARGDQVFLLAGGVW
jgi:hypothetical protein